MNVYIVTADGSLTTGSDDMQIIQVRPEDEAAFQQQYGGRVLITGTSIQDVLMQFGQHLNKESR